MTNILCCIDGSNYGGSVCDHASWAASMLGAEVELLHVLERTPDAIRTDLSGSVGLGDSATLLQRLMQLDESRGALRMERGRAILESAAARVSAAGGRISGLRLRTGGLVDSVKESEDGVRLVVLGRRGERADMAKAHFGGSAEQVIRASKLSVLVVPPIYKSIQNVLLAFDGSQCAILVEVFADLPAASVRIDGMPIDAGSATGRSNVNDRSPHGRLHGWEGQKVLLRQFARQVDSALRGYLARSDVPLVLAATQPLAAIYRSVNTYPHLTEATIEGSPGDLSDDELAEQARAVLDGLYREELARLRTLFDVRESQGRATTDMDHVARAATFGAVAVLLVDIDEITPGSVDEQTGAVTFEKDPDALSYGVVDEIAHRVMRAGGRVLGVRNDDMPGGKALAAILRYAT